MKISAIHPVSHALAVAVTSLFLVLPTKTHAQEVYIAEEEPITVQLHTNALYYAALSPNIVIELQTSLGVAFQFDYVGAWWNSYSKNRFWSNYAFQSELRYYLQSQKQQKPYAGHHLGAYGQLITYDFEFGGKGIQCADLKDSYAIGLAYGYTLPLSKHHSVDFTIGVGYFNSRYSVYEPGDDGLYYKTTTKRLKFFGPTRLEVSFIWNINKKNNK